VARGLLWMRGVSHQARFIEDGSVQSVTFRTVGGLHLLRPSAAINALILGVLGRTLALYDVALHAFVFMSNHGHLLATPRNGEEMSGFIGHLLGNIARGIARELRWSGHIWGDRATIIPVVDEDAQQERLRYIVRHGAKEGLVASPLDWPGVTCARALVGREELVGTWVDGAAAYEARRRKRSTDPSEYTSQYPIELAPLPAWASLSRAELQRRCEEMIRDAEAEARRARDGVLGAAAVLASDPLERSPEPARVRGEIPACHWGRPGDRDRFLARRRAFLSAHLACSEKRRAELDPEFPDRSYPVARRFVVHQPSLPTAVTTSGGPDAVPPSRAARPGHGPAPPRPPPAGALVTANVELGQRRRDRDQPVRRTAVPSEHRGRSPFAAEKQDRRRR